MDHLHVVRVKPDGLTVWYSTMRGMDIETKTTECPTWAEVFQWFPAFACSFSGLLVRTSAARVWEAIDAREVDPSIEAEATRWIFGSR